MKSVIPGKTLKCSGRRAAWRKARGGSEDTIYLKNFLEVPLQGLEGAAFETHFLETILLLSLRVDQSKHNTAKRSPAESNAFFVSQRAAIVQQYND